MANLRWRVENVKGSCKNGVRVLPLHMTWPQNPKDYIPIRNRFWECYTPEPNSGCWIWTEETNEYGYGRFVISNTKSGSIKTQAHRHAWALTNGPIPAKMCVCHTCDTPACINPSHLFLGTHKDNMQDMGRKGRTCIKMALAKKNATHCKRGHTYRTFSPTATRRHCHECTRLRTRQYRGHPKCL